MLLRAQLPLCRLGLPNGDDSSPKLGDCTWDVGGSGKSILRKTLLCELIMTDGIVGALISAFSGAVGYGAKAMQVRRDKVAKRGLVVARICAELEQFARSCIPVSKDWGEPEVQIHGQDEFVPWSRPPAFPELATLPDLDLLSYSLQCQLFALPMQAATVAEAVNDSRDFSTPPDHEEFYIARTRGYAGLGLAACDLADGLRASLGRSSNAPGDSDAREALAFALQHTIERADRATNATPIVDLNWEDVLSVIPSVSEVHLGGSSPSGA